jgi:hypothetical protein
MPKINEEDMIVELWNNYRAETFEQSKKFLEILKFLLTTPQS